MIQQLLTHVIEAIAISSAVYFGVAFITGYSAWKARKSAATAPAPMPSIHDFTDDELVTHLVAPLAESPDFAADAELPLEPEWFEQLQEIINAGNGHHQPGTQAIAPTITDTVVRFVRKPKAFELELMTSQELRKLCSDRGIRWRNAHGKGKHLSKSQMIQALLSASAA